MTRWSLFFTAVALTASTFALPPSLFAQDLNVAITASDEVVGPGDRTTYTLIASNTGSVDLNDVSVEVQLPGDINFFSDGPIPNFDCRGTTCDAGEIATWTVGTLAPGQNRTVTYRIQVSSGASSGVLTSRITASATGASQVERTLDITVDDSPLVRLHLAPESGPAVAGEEFTYTLTYGNIGTSNPTDVVASMPIPQGTTFVRATDDGTESGGTVTWTLGTLGAGGSGQVQVTVMVDASLEDGTLLAAEAELDPDTSTEPVATSSAVTPIESDVPLQMEYGVGQTALGTGDALDVILTATNTSPVDLTDVSAQVLLPDRIAFFSDGPVPDFDCAGTTCDANERATWSVGTLAPGQSRTIMFRTSMADDAPQGEVLQSLLVGESTSTGPVTAHLDLHVDPSPLLRLSLAPESGPAVAGDPFTYTMTVGNVGSTSPTNVVLALTIPEGTAFVSATNGGTESGGMVSWPIGTLGVGNSRQFQVTVRPDANLLDGALLLARAELDSGSATEVVVRSSAVTPVRANVPLRMEYGVNQTALGADDALDVTLTVTNTSPVDLTDVSAQVLLPGRIAFFSDGPVPDFDCAGTTCDANERATWSVGTLSPGQSRSVVLRTSIADNAPQGEVLRSRLIGASTSTGQVTASLDLHVDPTPLLRLSLAPESSPAVAGEPFLYTVTVGNVGTNNPSGVVLRVPLPPRTEFVSATDGGEVIGDAVVWDVNSRLSVQSAGQAQLTLRPDADLPDGYLLQTEAELDPGSPTEVVLRSSAVSPVRAGIPLVLEYTANRVVVSPDETVTYTLSATNTGAVDLTNVTANVLLPDEISFFSDGSISDFDCPGTTCDANERALWSVGTLASAETQNVSFQTTIPTSAPRGTPIRSLVVGTATGSDQVLLQRDLFIAENDSQLPVELAAFHVRLDDNSVMLEWTTASETNNAGFEVQMRRGADGLFAAQGFVDGRGTTTEAQTYRFRVDDLAPGTYAFRLKQVDLDGTSTLSSVVDVTVALAEAYVLSVVAPHPVRDAAQFTLQVRESQSVRAEMFDVLGRRVATLLNGPIEAGREHRLALNGRALASGLYLVRIVGEQFATTQRVTVTR